MSRAGSGAFAPAFESEHRVLRLSAKLFNVTPADLPPDVRGALTGWLGAAPAAVEGYMRPGCVLLNLHITLDSRWVAWWQLFSYTLLCHACAWSVQQHCCAVPAQRAHLVVWEFGAWCVQHCAAACAVLLLLLPSDGCLRACPHWKAGVCMLASA